MSYTRGYKDPLFKDIVKREFPSLYEDELKNYSKDIQPEKVLENFFKFKNDHINKKKPRKVNGDIDNDWIKAGEITEYFIRDIGVVKM